MTEPSAKGEPTPHQHIDDVLDEAGYWKWAGSHLTFCTRMGCQLCSLITALEAIRSHFQVAAAPSPSPQQPDTIAGQCSECGQVNGHNVYCSQWEELVCICGHGRSQHSVERRTCFKLECRCKCFAASPSPEPAPDSMQKFCNDLRNYDFESNLDMDSDQRKKRDNSQEEVGDGSQTRYASDRDGSASGNQRGSESLVDIPDAPPTTPAAVTSAPIHDEQGNVIGAEITQTMTKAEAAKRWPGAVTSAEQFALEFAKTLSPALGRYFVKTSGPTVYNFAEAYAAHVLASRRPTKEGNE